jgi:hypothetical protein
MCFEVCLKVYKKLGFGFDERYGRPSGNGMKFAPLPCSSSASISAPTSTTNALSHNQSSKITGAASEPYVASYEPKYET